MASTLIRVAETKTCPLGDGSWVRYRIGWVDDQFMRNKCTVKAEFYREGELEVEGFVEWPDDKLIHFEKVREILLSKRYNA